MRKTNSMIGMLVLRNAFILYCAGILNSFDLASLMYIIGFKLGKEKRKLMRYKK